MKTESEKMQGKKMKEKTMKGRKKGNQAMRSLFLFETLKPNYNIFLPEERWLCFMLFTC